MLAYRHAFSIRTSCEGHVTTTQESHTDYSYTDKMFMKMYLS